MRLIDADAMKRVYQEVLCSHVACIDCSFFMDDKYCRFETMLSEAPTINAIPVVRCRECKHRYTEDCPMYFHASYWHEGYEEYVDDDTDHTEDDYFCQEGEREEGADNEP